MAVTNAVRGLNNMIKNRQETIKVFDNMAKDWKDETAIALADAIKDFMTRDIGAFEWILKEVQNKKTQKSRLAKAGQ